jgi:putative ABC transport system permease protein
MIRMILKISLRNFLKHKLYSTINVLGLALGFTAFILIALFIRYEQNWDKSNTEYNNIYRIQRHYSKTMYAMDGNDISPHSRAITAQLIEKKYPEFKKVTVIRENGGKFLASDPGKQIYNNKGICADSCFFDVFTYKFIEGSKEGALDEPFSIALSKTMADRLFGGKKVLGETVILEKKFALNVVGVYEDLPENSSQRPDYIISFSTLDKTEGIKRSDLWRGDCMTYVLLNHGVDYKNLEKKIKNTFAGFKGIEFEELQLCPMKNLYLNFNGRNDYLTVLHLYGLIGLFILLMSAFNYVNLTTANSSIRNKEVALKKVCGSNRNILIFQFLGETVITSTLALFLAFQLANVTLPLFSRIFDRHLSLDLFNDLGFVCTTFVVSLIIGLLSGIYPALVLSSQRILSLFKSQLAGEGRNKLNLKNAIVTFQFAISIFLILITISFSLRIKYIVQKDPGFNRENILYTTILISSQEVIYDQLRNRILQHAEIKDASVSKNLPFVNFGGGMTNWEGGDKNEKISCRYNTVSYDFVTNLGIQVIAGRDFSRDFPGDLGKSCLINETAARCFGWDEPIGKKLNDNHLTVVGVLKNYIYKDIHNSIEPAILTLAPEKLSGEWTFAFRIDRGSEKKVKTILNDELGNAFPNDPFEINDLSSAFVNENSFKIYNSVNKTILFFTVFNVFLAMIGLFGLVSFTVVRRTKEIGIRKINGSSSVNIFYLISREYYIMLLLAALISFPAGYLIYEQIPGANRLPVHPWVFILSGVIVFIIIFITTSYQTIRAAIKNPVEALRYE